MNKIKPKFRELIENKLKAIDKDFKLKVNVKSTQNYAIAAQGLANGTEAIAFLQTKLHYDNRGVEHSNGTYDKIGVLLKSTRQAISAEKENDKNIQSDWSETISAKESWTIVKNYNQLSQNINSKKDVQDRMFVKNDNTDTEYYRSCIYANKDFLNQNGFDKIQTEQDYINTVKAIILKASKSGKMQLGKTNSSASYTYPLKWMKDVLQFTDEEIKEVIKSHTSSDVASIQNVAKLADGEIFITAGYGDIRTELEDNQIKKAYDNIQVLGVADAVPNDAIQYSRKWFKNDQKLLKNLRKAFKELVQEPANHEIFNDIYSHKNYIAPDENASETDIIKWEANVEKNYTAIEKKFKNINDLIIASTVK